MQIQVQMNTYILISPHSSTKDMIIFTCSIPRLFHLRKISWRYLLTGDSPLLPLQFPLGKCAITYLSSPLLPDIKLVPLLCYHKQCYNEWLGTCVISYLCKFICRIEAWDCWVEGVGAFVTLVDVTRIPALELFHFPLRHQGQRPHASYNFAKAVFCQDLGLWPDLRGEKWYLSVWF